MNERIQNLDLLYGKYVNVRKALVKLNIESEKEYNHLRPKQLQAISEASKGDHSQLSNRLSFFLE